MIISHEAVSFLRGYFADIQDLSNVQQACKIIFREKNNDSIYSYLVDLSILGLDCWIKSFQEFLDRENMEYAEKFRKIYDRVQDRTILLYPDFYDMRPLNEYDAFPATKENAGEALEKGTCILENLAHYYRLSRDSRKDSIAALCLIQFVRKTEIVLGNFLYYNVGFLNFIPRDDEQKYDFQDMDMLKSFLLSDNRIHYPELEELELIISEHREVGKYLHEIINNDSARASIRKVSNDEEMRMLFYQTALFYAPDKNIGNSYETDHIRQD